MCRRHSALILVATCLLWPSGAKAADPVRVLVVSGGGEIVSAAARAFVARHGDGLIDVRVSGPDASAAQLAGVDVVFFHHPPADTLVRLAAALAEAQARGTVVLGTPRIVLEQHLPFLLDRSTNNQAELYWQYGGAQNMAGFLTLAYGAGGGATSIAREPPKVAVTNGIYHPGASTEPGGQRPFASLRDYLDWYRAAGRVPATAPLVGITFHADNIRLGDLAHIDALVNALEQRGIGAVPVYGWPLTSVEQYLTIDGTSGVSQLAEYAPRVHSDHEQPAATTTRPVASREGHTTSPLRLLLALNLTIVRQDDVTLLDRLGVHVMNLAVTREDEPTWQAGATGLPADRLSPQLNVPERAGATEPMLVATARSDGDAAMRPVDERVQSVARRAQRWIALQDRHNDSKRVAILYYNNPPGRGNVGASYLRVYPTLARVLERLHGAGYATGDQLPDDRQLMRLLEQGGRNVELWAPGELDAMVRQGHAALVPLDTYRRWFADLPPAFRDAVLREWGPPEQAQLMVHVNATGERFFVVPGIRFGNVFIGPQPLRTTFDRAISTAHDRTLAVPHAYVAAYLWYRHTFAADAVVHIGRHGTLEWLPGKQVAQSGSDHTEVLLGDLPNAYFYIMDGGGEAIQAKRRGAAVLLSHLTPLIVAGGAQADFDTLHQALDQLERVEPASPELAREYQNDVLTDLRRLGLDRQLGVDLDTTPWPDIRAAAHDFAHAVTNHPIPAGIHAVGETPPDDVQREALAAVIAFGFPAESWPSLAPDLDAWVDAIMRGDEPRVGGSYPPALRQRVVEALASARLWLTALRASPSQEIEALVRVLGGRRLPTGLLGDPLRVPAALPTGRNLHAFDAALIPTRAAWALGRTMADRTLAKALADTGRYPDSVALSLWYGETERHQGAMEAMALHLLGVEPIWNARGDVEDVRLIPDHRLTHPRINVVFTITGIYRDGFADKVLLLDRAARLAASAGDSAVSRHDRAVMETLTSRGVAADEAGRLARARVFGNQPGRYGLGVERMVDSGLNAGRDDDLAKLFLANMNYAFSSETWGGTAADTLATHLRGNDTVIFSRSSNLYGALDNEDTYAYVGGLSLASRLTNGVAPRFDMHDLRKPGDEATLDLRTWLAYELNARLWNPKWLDGMKRSGYAGARQVAQELDHLYGFQATVPEQMDGSFWQQSFDVLVADRHGLQLAAFFAAENPDARQRLLARLIDVDRQGAYTFPDADRRTLIEQYVRSVNRDGFSCAALTCSSQRLHHFALTQAARIPGLGAQERRAFQHAVARATQPPATATPVTGGPRPLAAPSLRRAPEARPPVVTGFVMREPAPRASRLRQGVGAEGLETSSLHSLVYAAALIGILCVGALREAASA